jgi:hypothetical protein
LKVNTGDRTQEKVALVIIQRRLEMYESAVRNDVREIVCDELIFSQRS